MRRKAASIFGIGPRAICAPKTNFFDPVGRARESTGGFCFYNTADKVIRVAEILRAAVSAAGTPAPESLDREDTVVTIGRSVAVPSDQPSSVDLRTCSRVALG
jgi:hypothetical protein